MPTIQDRFRIRRGTAAALAAANEVPLADEMVYESDSGHTDGKYKIKIGDGVTPWNDLAYLATGDGGGGASGVNLQTGTEYTFVLADDGLTVIGSNAAAIAFTIPADADVAFAIGAKIAYTQGAAGTITISGGANVTVHAPNGNATGAQWDGGVAEKIAADEWQLWNGPALGALATAADAPSDSKTYGRKDGAWAEVSAGGGGGGGSITGINEQTGTTYTLAAGDATQAVRCTNVAAIALTIPTNASVALPLYCMIPVLQGGAGAVTASGASGVTLESPNGAATTGVGDFRTLFQRATDIWVIG